MNGHISSNVEFSLHLDDCGDDDDDDDDVDNDDDDDEDAQMSKLDHRVAPSRAILSTAPSQAAKASSELLEEYLCMYHFLLLLWNYQKILSVCKQKGDTHSNVISK